MTWSIRWLDRTVTPPRSAWCAAKRQTKSAPKYADSMATACGQFIMLPHAIENEEPTCPECIEALKKRAKR